MSAAQALFTCTIFLGGLFSVALICHLADLATRPPRRRAP